LWFVFFAGRKHEKIKFVYSQDNLLCGSKIGTGYRR